MIKPPYAARLKGMKMQELAGKVGVSRQLLYAYITGKCRTPLHLAVKIQQHSQGVFKAKDMVPDLKELISDAVKIL